MSEKVRFYLILDLIGVAITFVIRYLLVKAVLFIPEPLIQTILIIALNILTALVCLFILFFFLLYWWSDKKWTSVKKKWRKFFK